MHSVKSIIPVAVVALLQLGTASAQLTDYPYQAPTSSDSRSNCPGLNALANHGLLPRDGKNIDLAALAKGTYLGFSLAEDAARLVGTVGLQASTTGNAASFNLADLNQHDPQVIEHDGSMTREDAYTGDAVTFSDAAYARTQANWGTNDIISVSASEISLWRAPQLTADPNVVRCRRSRAQGAIRIRSGQ